MLYDLKHWFRMKWDDFQYNFKRNRCYILHSLSWTEKRERGWSTRALHCSKCNQDWWGR